MTKHENISVIWHKNVQLSAKNGNGTVNFYGVRKFSQILLLFSILKDMLKVQQNIGYCPQFDSLFDELTAREHIQLYARLRGVPPKEEKQVGCCLLEGTMLLEAKQNREFSILFLICLGQTSHRKADCNGAF